MGCTAQRCLHYRVHCVQAVPRTYATRALANGVPTRVVSDTMGHSGSTVTIDSCARSGRRGRLVRVKGTDCPNSYSRRCVGPVAIPRIPDLGRSTTGPGFAPGLHFKRRDALMGPLVGKVGGQWHNHTVKTDRLTPVYSCIASPASTRNARDPSVAKQARLCFRTTAQSREWFARAV